MLTRLLSNDLPRSRVLAVLLVALLLALAVHALHVSRA